MGSRRDFLEALALGVGGIYIPFARWHRETPFGVHKPVWYVSLHTADGGGRWIQTGIDFNFDISFPPAEPEFDMAGPFIKQYQEEAGRTIAEMLTPPNLLRP